MVGCLRAGDWLGWGEAGTGDEAAEQTPDDERSFCLTSPPLTQPLELLGFPALHVRVRVNQPEAALHARLTALIPGDGSGSGNCSSWLLSRGVLNLNHVPHTNHTVRRRITPGQTLTVGECDHHLSVSLLLPAHRHAHDEYTCSVV